MAARSDTGGMQKEFEYYEIVWEIEDYFLVTFKKKWTLSGPKILVSNPKTEWRMTLKSENQTNSINLRLERLDSETHIVRINWRVTLKSKKEEMYFKPDLEFNRVSPKFCCSQIYLKEKFEKKFPPLEDTLIIFCQLVVSHIDDFTTRDITFPLQPTLKDLRLLHKNKKYDIEIINKSSLTDIETTIKAHKEVLHQSSRTFEQLIDQGRDLIVLEQDGCALERVILYFYTNDLKFVLSEPTISLFECLFHLRVNKALKYYTPGYVNLKTTLDVHNCTFKWTIKNVSGKIEDTIITSPILIDSISETCWKMELKLERVDAYVRASISAKSTGNVNLMAVEFTVEKNDGIIVEQSESPCLMEGNGRLK